MSTLQVNTLKTYNSAPPVIQNSSGTEVGTFCRAFVNFDGTGTVAIRNSFNVSSITDHGTGDYTVNFTTAMPDANYAVTAQTASTAAVVGRAWQNTTRAVAATGSIAIGTVNFGSSFADLPSVFVAIFR